MLRIVLVGKDRTAKLWAARYLWYAHGFRYKQLGDPLRKFIGDSHFYVGRERRKAMTWDQKQAIYDFMYKLEPDIWTKYLEYRLKTTVTDLVVPDVRYISELDHMRDNLGFTVVRVLSPAPRTSRKIGRILGKESSPGTLYLADLYMKDFTEKIRADYSINIDLSKGHRQSGKDSLDQLVKIWREKVDN